MSRKSSKKTPVVISGSLYTDDDWTGTRLSSAQWFEWLSQGYSFYFEGADCSMTVRAELRRKGLSWYAFKKQNGKLKKHYVGRIDALTIERLEQIAHGFA